MAWRKAFRDASRSMTSFARRPAGQLKTVLLLFARVDSQAGLQNPQRALELLNSLGLPGIFGAKTVDLGLKRVALLFGRLHFAVIDVQRRAAEKTRGLLCLTSIGGLDAQAHFDVATLAFPGELAAGEIGT